MPKDLTKPMSHEEFADLSQNDAREQLLRRAFPEEDDLPAQITLVQLLRVEQIISELLRSDDVELPRRQFEQLKAVEIFLMAVVTTTGTMRDHVSLDPREKWAALDALRIVPPTPSAG